MNKEFSSEYDYKKSFTIEEDALKYGLINYSHLTVKKTMMMIQILLIKLVYG